jgi:uncharacterized phiE125 gp8 family phage protein
MRAFVVTPPAPVVTWAEADRHLKLDGDSSQQADVDAMIAAATATLEGPGGWLGRALGLQTLEVRYDSCETFYRLKVPFPPTVEILSLIYLDANRAEQTVDPADYELAGSEILLIPASPPWSGGLWGRESVRIRYRAGYDQIPANIRAAILLMVGDLYRFRETATVGVTAAAVPMSTTVENLLAPSRVFC